jgi:asparagine synthase (glutamine-hydrolysing)
MCGIVGILDPEARDDLSPVTEDMLRAIVHRGPDDSGVFTDGNIALGSCRLSIIDLAGGHQPMTNEDGSVVVVFNGEIYNHRALSDDLRRRGHTMASRSDTETIVHLYEEYGDELVHRLRGMFAFAIWDARRKRLLIARDRLGIKPLYYAVRGSKVVFASEIKALLVEGSTEPTVDLDSLVQFLALKYVPSPGTLFDGVRSLPPGHLLTSDGHNVSVRRWWQLSFTAGDGAVDEAESALRLREILQESVRVHLESDVPFGAFLSGGLDSSTIVALMSQTLGRVVKTFSIGYDGDDSAISELPYARLIADRYETDHHEVIVSARDFVESAERVVWHLDQPIADGATLPNLLLSDAASREVKMVLTGEGGDELFAGYARHVGERLAPAVRAVPTQLRTLALAAAGRMPGMRRPKLAFYALSQRDEATRFVSWFALFNQDRLASLLSAETSSAIATDRAIDVFRGHLADTDASEPLSRMLYLDTVLWLPDDLLARGDKTSMAASLEARLPLLDHTLVEFAASLPSRLKIRGLTRKYLLRRVAREWLPDAVLSRRKQGFPTPLANWFRGEAKPLLYDHLSGDAVRSRGLFDAGYVSRLLDEHDRGFADHSSMLFGLLTLEIWQRLFVDTRSRVWTHAPPGRQ